MSARTSSLAAVERNLLALFPHPPSNPEFIGQFAESFGESCNNAADAVTLMVDVLKPADLAAYAERLAGIVVDGIEIAAVQMGVSDSPWVHQGQRWAVQAFFARIAELQDSMVTGGRA